MCNKFYRLLFFLILLFANSFAQDTSVYQYSKIENGFYYDFNKLGNKIDSVPLYTPINFFTIGTHDDTDTLFLINLSNALYELNEPLIYESQGNNCFRFAYFRDTLPVVFRIKILEEDRFLVTRKISNGSTPVEVGKIISNDSTSINQKQFNKILELLRKGSFWNFPKNQIVATPNILIETFLQSKYNFITGDSSELQWNSSTNALYKCYNYLNRLFR